MKLKKIKFIVSLFSLYEEHWLWSFDKKRKILRALNLGQEKNKKGGSMVHIHTHSRSTANRHRLVMFLSMPPSHFTVHRQVTLCIKGSLYVSSILVQTWQWVIWLKRKRYQRRQLWDGDFCLSDIELSLFGFSSYTWYGRFKALVDIHIVNISFTWIDYPMYYKSCWLCVQYDNALLKGNQGDNL